MVVVSRSLWKHCHTIEAYTLQQDRILLVKFGFSFGKFSFTGCYLEASNDPAARVAQLSTIRDSLPDNTGSFICGDFDFRDDDGDHYPPDNSDGSNLDKLATG